MAQLKDDCFAIGEKLTSLDEALSIMQERINIVTESTKVSIDESLNRILCADVISKRNVPPHDNSAVDGYAVYSDDLDGDSKTRLPFTGRISAGHPLNRQAQRGEALRIFTGAPMPFGADGTTASGPDTVFMEEDVTIDGDMVVFPTGLKKGSNRREIGEDIRADTTILRKGDRLRAQDLGLVASVGLVDLPVYSLLRVAVFSTGDEIREPSTAAPDGCVFDANRYSIKALLVGLGCEVTDLGILGDDQETIELALREASLNHDLLITSGGVSLGEEDHVRAAVESTGNIHLWRLAIKPGRPIALGQVGQAAFVGLPGNPVAALVTFALVARPIILWMAGASNVKAQRFKVVSGFDYTKKPGRREWVRVRLENNADDILVAFKDHPSGAGILTSMVGADGLVELTENIVKVMPGDPVHYLPFCEVSL